MRRISRMLLVAGMGVMSMTCYTSCSGKADKEASATTGKEVVSESENPVSSGNDWDIERINAYYNHKGSLSEKDYDYIIGQLEIFVEKQKSMSPEAFQEYFDNFNKKEASAYMFFVLTPADAKMKGKLTQKQIERFDALKPYLK